jgi:hypothetical protein
MLKTPITEDMTMLVEINGVQLYEASEDCWMLKYTEPGQQHPHGEIYYSWPEAEANFARRVGEEDYR